MVEQTAAFLDRYPYYEFLLSVTPYVPLQQEEEDASLFQKELEDVHAQVLYVFGLGLGGYYDAAKEWLDRQEGRQLIFLENDLGVIAHGIDSGKFDQVFSDHRVHLCFSLDKRGFAEAVSRLFPSESIEALLHVWYKKRYASYFTTLKSALIRSSVLSFAHRQESLHYHHLFRNMVSNFLTLEEAFSPHLMKDRFKDVPAIIVGAGPSLAEAIPFLKTLQDRALLFAGGSSIIALGKEGIAPHLGFAIDPNPEEYTRLKQSRFLGMPLIFGSRLMPRVPSIFAGPYGYVKTSTGGPFEAWMEEKLAIEGDSLLDERDSEALSVTIIAVKTAILLGCNPIVFTGLDLSYRKKERYVKGVLPTMTLSLEKDHLLKRTAELSIRRKGRKGLYVETAYKWIMESRCLASIAKGHPETTFLDATEHGLAIQGVPYHPLEKIPFDRQFSLDERLHKEICAARLPLTREKIEQPLRELKESLGRVAALLDEILEEPSHPRAIAAELDLKNELAYEILLRHVDHYSSVISEEGRKMVKELCL